MHYIMETINVEYIPLYPGTNTIRRMSDKYKDMRPGDTIEMQYRQTKTRPVIATEHHIVKSVAIGTLEQIAMHHSHWNHAEFSSWDQCMGCIKALYGTDEGLFMAIYV